MALGASLTCFQRGMISHRVGNKRSVTVYKDKKKKKSDRLERKDSAITFSEEAKRVLFDLFTHYPPGEDELRKQKLNEPSDSTPKSRSRRDTIFHRPIMDKAEIAKKVDMLTSRIRNLPKLKKVLPTRNWNSYLYFFMDYSIFLGSLQVGLSYICESVKSDLCFCG